jgi:hypothetical protein
MTLIVTKTFTNLNSWKDNITMNWTKLNFGKHKGKNLPQIIFADADWFFYALENRYFKNGLAYEAAEIYRRARAIKVPQVNGQRMLVEYIIHKPTWQFGTMKLITDDSDLGHLDVSSVIDFYKPRSFDHYDKFGYKNFVLALKDILFQDPSRRMSKQAREDFFSNDGNFDLSYASRKYPTLRDGLSLV